MKKIEIRDDHFRDLALLMAIQSDPDISQSTLAENLGVAIGTVNGRIRQLSEGGLIEVNRLKRRKLRYTITPKGISLQRKLTQEFVQQSFDLFRQVRQKVKVHLVQLAQAGVHAVRLNGDGDIAEVCRLTCLEQHFDLTDDKNAPILVVDGLNIRLEHGN